MAAVYQSHQEHRHELILTMIDDDPAASCRNIRFLHESRIYRLRADFYTDFNNQCRVILGEESGGATERAPGASVPTRTVTLVSQDAARYQQTLFRSIGAGESAERIAATESLLDRFAQDPTAADNAILAISGATSHEDAANGRYNALIYLLGVEKEIIQDDVRCQRLVEVLDAWTGGQDGYEAPGPSTRERIDDLRSRLICDDTSQEPSE
ncbi:hypothetical protein [Maricaulis maris]|uniref:hypothetical protein n=1 Tax=Maricaulis maris TaxID=74318 RepID=UPI0011C343CF|nr:hypothetical protein [Maricaulis maris]